MSVPEISVVIVSYNTRRYLERCLHTLAATAYEVTVVDNDSKDGSAELVRSRFPHVQLLSLVTNRGFGAAANRGIEATTSRYCLVLNPDAWPQDASAIQRLLECAERIPDAGVLGPSLIGPEGAPQVSRLGIPTQWWTGAPAVTAVQPGRVWAAALRLRSGGRSFLIGAVLLLRRAALEEVGGFDTDFFMFGEEVDLCLRMQKAGWRIARCPESVFVHVGGAATGRDWPAMYREQLRSHLRLLSKTEGPLSAERARRYLRGALRARAFLVAGEKRDLYRETAGWLASADADALTRPSGAGGQTA